jgi:hypothetical protein
MVFDTFKRLSFFITPFFNSIIYCMKKIFTLLLLCCVFMAGMAQTVSYTTAGSTYSENFDGLFATGTTLNAAASGPYELTAGTFAGNNVPAWYVERYAGSGTNVVLAVGDGSANGGQHYSFGAVSATERALGMLASGTRIGRVGTLIVNNTGTTLNSITVTFVTEMWRKGNAAVAHIYPFSYKTGATAINDATGFVAVTNLNLVTPNLTGTNDLARNGNDPAFRTAVTYTITGITWTAGQTLALRWDDLNDTGNDDALAIDDFQFSATASVSPTLSATPGNITVPNTVFGIASTAATYSLTGTNLNGSTVTVTAPANFEVSTDGVNFASSQNVAYTAPNLSATISVRLAATAPIGGYTGQLVVNAGGGATTVNVTASGNVYAGEPTVQATNVLITAVTNTSFTVNWTNGNGSGRLVTIRTTGPKVAPADGTTYGIPGNTGSGNLVYYVGPGSGPLNVTGLVPGTNYTVQVYEFNGSGAGINYLAADATGNPATTTTLGTAPTLTKTNFTSVAAPQFSGSGNGSRLPVMYYATISGLKPNTIYRYVNQAAIGTDLGGTALGAGNPLLIDYTVSPPTFIYSSAPSVGGTNSYGLFETNAGGSFTGAFGFVNTGNARFTAGNMIYPSIEVAEDVTYPAAQYRYALSDSIRVLAFGNTIHADSGTFIKGLSLATPGNVVGLWNTVDGNLVAQRPLSMTIVENITTTGATWGASFVAGYDLSAGAWNTIIPNQNANGVRLIQQFDLVTGTVIGCNSDPDGIWPSGANTVNPTGGLTPIQITSLDAPLNGGSCFPIVLPVNISKFAVQKSGNSTRIFWTTSQEVNTDEFIVERSVDGGRTWTVLTTVAAAGTSSAELNYQTTDFNPAKGLNLYRLKSVDIDGRFTTSDTRSALFAAETQVLITPNPTTDIATIYFSKTNNSVTQIVITDMSGKVLGNIRTTDQTYALPAARYGKGMFILKVISEGSTSTHKIIVQ